MPGQEVFIAVANERVPKVAYKSHLKGMLFFWCRKYYYYCVVCQVCVIVCWSLGFVLCWSLCWNIGDYVGVCRCYASLCKVNLKCWFYELMLVFRIRYVNFMQNFKVVHFFKSCKTYANVNKKQCEGVLFCHICIFYLLSFILVLISFSSCKYLIWYYLF